MKQSVKPIIFLLTVMVLIFWFRFSILNFTFNQLSQTKIFLKSGRSFSPNLQLQYVQLFRPTDKNLFVGSSVFDGYLYQLKFLDLDPNIIKKYKSYFRINRGYFLFNDEFKLLNRSVGKNIIFFLQPGELSLPNDFKPFSSSVVPIGTEELMDHIDALKSYYLETGETDFIRLIAKVYLPEYLLNRSLADSIYFSIFSYYIKSFLTYPKPYYNLSKDPPKDFVLDRSIQIIETGNNAATLHFFYMKNYIKKLLQNHTVTFVELSHAPSCEEESTLKYRKVLYSLMERLKNELKNPQMNFIKRDELPLPANTFFKDCIHVNPQYPSKDKLDFLKSYFNNVLEKVEAQY